SRRNRRRSSPRRLRPPPSRKRGPLRVLLVLSSGCSCRHYSGIATSRNRAYSTAILAVGFHVSVNSRLGYSRIDTLHESCARGGATSPRATAHRRGSDRGQSAFRGRAGALVVKQLGASCFLFTGHGVRISRRPRGNRHSALDARPSTQLL